MIPSNELPKVLQCLHSQVSAFMSRTDIEMDFKYAQGKSSVEANTGTARLMLCCSLQFGIVRMMAQGITER